MGMVSRAGMGGGSEGAKLEDVAGEIEERGTSGPRGCTAIRSRAYSLHSEETDISTEFMYRSILARDWTRNSVIQREIITQLTSPSKISRSATSFLLRPVINVPRTVRSSGGRSGLRPFFSSS